MRTRPRRRRGGEPEPSTMRITINEVSPDGTVVQFSYDGGRADGVWLGPETPRLGDADVTWEIPGRFLWIDEIRISNPRGKIIFLDQRDDQRPLIGKALAIDPDGLLALAIGGDEVRISTLGDQPEDLIGQTIELDTPLIELTPAGAR